MVTLNNKLNFVVVKFDYDLVQVSNSSNIVTNLTSPPTSVKFEILRDWMFYCLTDNTTAFKILVAYPNQTYDFWQFRLFEDDSGVAITRIHDIVKEGCEYSLYYD